MTTEKINIQEICNFIKEHSISLGVTIVYEYNRIYLTEHTKIKNPDFFRTHGYNQKLYIQKNKRYKKNTINLAMTNALHQKDYKEFKNWCIEINKKIEDENNKFKQKLIKVFKDEITAKEMTKKIEIMEKNEEHYKKYKNYYDYYRNNKN